MSFLVNYSIFCVPTLHINDYRNGDIVLNTLITEFITLCVKHHMTGKVPKSKDFYKVSLCSNTIVSTCPVRGNISNAQQRSAEKPRFSRTARSRARVAGLQDT